MDLIGLEEEPMGIFYSDDKPEEGLSPNELATPTREKEMKNEIDWGEIFQNFSCAIGHVWRARKKQTAAYFDATHYGCPGAAFWLGFMKPQTELIIHYVSGGIPEQLEGELYCKSADELRRIFEYIDPEPAPKKYCIFKPISQFKDNETPLLAAFFTRPEPLCGLHQLVLFMTNDPETVASPWGPACGNIITWPRRYLAKGLNRAVLGGWDPSARKFFKPDELSFTVPYAMFQDMLECFDRSFLTTKTWQNVKKKAALSQKTWKKD